jgi:hypothetical protein
LAREGAAIRTERFSALHPLLFEGKEGMQSRVDPVATRPPERRSFGYLTL